MCQGVSAVEVSCAALGSGQLSQGPHSVPPQGYPRKTWILGAMGEGEGCPEPKEKRRRGAGYHSSLGHHTANMNYYDQGACSFVLKLHLNMSIFTATLYFY